MSVMIMYQLLVTFKDCVTIFISAWLQRKPKLLDPVMRNVIKLLIYGTSYISRDLDP
jgi:hypothetical protein